MYLLTVYKSNTITKRVTGKKAKKKEVKREERNKKIWHKSEMKLNFSCCTDSGIVPEMLCPTCICTCMCLDFKNEDECLASAHSPTIMTFHLDFLD